MPQFCFWAFNGPIITVVQDLYDKIYKPGKYPGLWFFWEGKPLLLYNGSPSVDANGNGVKNPNPHYNAMAATDSKHAHFGDPDYAEEFYRDYTKEVKSFFTLRTMWWGYWSWAGPAPPFPTTQRSEADRPRDRVWIASKWTSVLRIGSDRTVRPFESRAGPAAIRAAC